MELQNRRFHILAGIRRPLVLSVGSELLRVSRRWRSNSSAFDFRAHVIHVFCVHLKTRSRIMVDKLFRLKTIDSYLFSSAFCSPRPPAKKYGLKKSPPACGLC